MSDYVEFFAKGPCQAVGEEEVAVLEPRPERGRGSVPLIRNDLRLAVWARLLLSLPPFAVLSYLAYVGMFRTPLLALAWGAPLLAGALGWARLMCRRWS